MELYKYEKHHLEYMQKCQTQGMGAREILNNWPFDDMKKLDEIVGKPTMSSLVRKIRSLKSYGLESVLSGVNGRGSRKKWTEQEIEDLILAFELCNYAHNDSCTLYVGDNEFTERTKHAVAMKVQNLSANGKMILPKMGKPKDYTDIFRSKGLNIIGNPKGHLKTRFTAECIAFGHKSEIRADIVSGCRHCANAGYDLTLEELAVDPRGRTPAICYFIQFEDGTLKTGHTTEEDVELRGKGWPPYKVIKQIRTTLYEAIRIEKYSQHKIQTIELYEPLQGNGGTECFEERHYEELLHLLSKEEDLLLHGKNSS